MNILKTTALILLFSAVQVNAQTTSFEKDGSVRVNDAYNKQQLKAMAVVGASMAKSKGWKCDSISYFSPFVWSRGFTLICNNYRYKYELLNKGGNWVITLK